MKNRLAVGLVLLLLLAGALTASAQQTVFAAYNKPGNVNIYATVGYGQGSGFLGIGVSPEFIIGKFDIGPHPDFTERVSLRRVEFRRRQTQRAIPAHPLNLLHRPFAVAFAADDGAAAMIAHRTGDDFAGTGAVAIDQ